MKSTKLIVWSWIAALAVMTATYGQTPPTPTPKPDAKGGMTPAEMKKAQAETRKMVNDTLERLYKAEPLAKGVVENAVGYAVFSDVGIKILVAGTGKGHGIAVNNTTKKETFMKMFEVQAGLGFGLKKFKVIFVFDNESVFKNFVDSGWEFGGQTTAAAKAGEGKGGSMAGAASVSDGIWMYQLTDKGVAIEITAKSTKYYKDDDLNPKEEKQP